MGSQTSALVQNKSSQSKFQEEIRLMKRIKHIIQEEQENHAAAHTSPPSEQLPEQ